jgi:hypothetical protein
MSAEQVATKILWILKDHGSSIKTLRNLARELEFPSAASSEFKSGLKFLIDKKIIEVHQSGWRSEKRDCDHHPQGIILLSDVYTVDLSQDIEAGAYEPNTALIDSGIYLGINKDRPREKCCFLCKTYSDVGMLGYCPKFQWEMSLEVAKREILCSFVNQPRQ